MKPFKQFRHSQGANTGIFMLELQAKETQALQQIRLADPTKLSSSLYQPEGIQSELEQEHASIQAKNGRETACPSVCVNIWTQCYQQCFKKKITLLGKEQSLRLS